MKREDGTRFDYQVETVASRGRSYARVEIALCDDGLYRFAVCLLCGNEGYWDAVRRDVPGYPAYEQAKQAGIDELIRRFPKPSHAEPAEMLRQLQNRQASLL